MLLLSPISVSWWHCMYVYEHDQYSVLADKCVFQLACLVILWRPHLIFVQTSSTYSIRIILTLILSIRSLYINIYVFYSIMACDKIACGWCCPKRDSSFYRNWPFTSFTHWYLFCKWIWYLFKFGKGCSVLMFWFFTQHNSLFGSRVGCCYFVIVHIAHVCIFSSISFSWHFRVISRFSRSCLMYELSWNPSRDLWRRSQNPNLILKVCTWFTPIFFRFSNHCMTTISSWQP